MSDRPFVVVGGAGFVGANLAESWLAQGERVLVIDTLARPGVERNLAWLRERHGERLAFAPVDVRDGDAIGPLVAGARAVVHLAAQVAVTTSLADPLCDLDVNARGTLVLLEAVRRADPRIPVLFASTNKVYGELADIALEDGSSACMPRAAAIRDHGVGEDRPLDFHTPYGCSKGVADQYVLDYARSFGLRTAVMRMSCVYGPRQFGTEDQGWVAHFLISALKGLPITLFGDGRQVRDVLHVADAVDAYRGALSCIDAIAGTAFNLGGGPANAVSLRAVIAEIERLTGARLDVEEAEPRAGDQRWFVADTRRLAQSVGWRATIGWREGLADLHEWLRGQDFVRARDVPKGLVPLAGRAMGSNRETDGGIAG